MNGRHNITVKPGLSINTILLLCFVVVALVPISFFGAKVYDAAWDNAWREVREKHQLLAENLAAPISIYVNKQQNILALTVHLIKKADPTISGTEESLRGILNDCLENTEGFHGLYLIDGSLKVKAHATDQVLNLKTGSSHFSSGKYLVDTLLRGEKSVSAVIKHPFTGKPSIFVVVPIVPDTGDRSRLALVAELQIEPIEMLRRGIRFGKGGHSAIVDQYGRVIAHPNRTWMDEAHDLSKLDIVQSMMAGKTNVTEFYSPFKKKQMVAGYTSVAGLGWGIMVPQPMEEIEAHVREILYSQFSWAIIGLILAIAVALYLGRWITKPINDLASAGNRLSQEKFKHNLPRPRSYAPKEVQQLADAFSDAIEGLSVSRAEVEMLNENLQQRVYDATTELRQANTKLSVQARSDHLTKLSNRRHFEQTISSMTLRRKGDEGTICLLLVDVDHFKEINDKYGHPAGDMVLVQIADILDRNMRQSDMAARYAGDEFILLIHAGIDIGRERASSILAEISARQFIYDRNSITVTVSIGLVCFGMDNQDNNFDVILRKVDKAMYKAKGSGRNTVSELTVETATD